jgi:hypothetical protein
MFNLSQDKWFVSWQAKDVVKVEPSPPLPPTSNFRENDTTAVAAASPAPGGGAAGSAAAAAASARAAEPSAKEAKAPSQAAPAAAPATVGLWLFCFPWEGGSPSVFEALSWQVTASPK